MGSADQITGPYDCGTSVVVDTEGNIYTAGIFRGTADFDPGPETFNLTASNTEIFVSKFSEDGSFIWAIGLGGSGADVVNKIVLDNDNNFIITGYFSGTADFDPQSSVQNLISAGSSDAYVAKFTSDGNLIWAKNLGGLAYDWGTGIALVSDGILVTGHFGLTADFDPGPSTYNLTATGTWDGFILKLTQEGNFSWVKRIGGSGNTYPSGISVDQAGNIGIFGQFDQNTDMDPSATNFMLLSAGNLDLFFAKYDSTGNFIWAKRVGGTGLDYPNATVQDDQGNFFLTGYYSGNVDFDPSASMQMLSSNATGCFVAKYNLDGNLIFAKGFSSSLVAKGNGITHDAVGNIYIAGQFKGVTDFDPGVGVYTLNSESYDIFIVKLNALGELVWVQQIGSSVDAEESGRAIIHDGNGNIIVTGCFAGTADFNYGSDSSLLTSYGGVDAFIYKASDTNLGLNSIASNLQFKIYPNPANDYVMVSDLADDAEVTIFDILGKEVFKKANFNRELKIDITQYDAGIYMVQLRSEGKTANKKLVVN